MTDSSGRVAHRMRPVVSTEPTELMFGLDVGGTKILGVGLIAGKVVCRERVATPIETGDVVASIAAVIEQLVEQVGAPAAVGVGLAGLVDGDGVLRYGPNLPGVVDLDLGAALTLPDGVGLVVVNDANCAAVAEHRLGAARGCRHAVVVTLGTGIGAGLIIDDRLHLGASGFAGEPGHTLIDGDGPVCACGAAGCWEALASGAGLSNLTRLLVEQGRAGGIVARAGGRVDDVRGEHVVAALLDGDRDAEEVIERFAGWVAAGISNLVVVLDPEVVVLGGGLSDISDRFLPLVSAAMEKRTMGAGHRPAVPVLAARLGPEAGAVGAALLAGDSARSGIPAAAGARPTGRRSNSDPRRPRER